MRAAVADAAQASAQLAGKFLEAGNISVLQCKLEEAAATQARLQALRADAEATRTRSALNATMGLSEQAAVWSAADRLPAPLAVDDTVDALLPLARGQRLDLDAAQREVALLEQGLDVTRRYRLLGKVDLGIAGERETDRSKLYGPSLSLQLPIFNQGQGAVARASAQLDAARARVRSLDLDIESAVRLGVDRVAATRGIAAEYRAALIPQREAIVARTQEQQNYMLVGVFELMLARQQEFDAYQAYLEAVRDYWLARVDLQRTVGAQLPSDTASTEPTVGPDDILRAAAQPDMQHMHHGDAGASTPGTDRARHAEPSSPQQKHRAKQPQGHEGHDMHDMRDMPGMAMPPDAAPETPPHGQSRGTPSRDTPADDRHGGTP
jgi:cobalt-zinc-cadmium efflux system outer membrane protein